MIKSEAECIQESLQKIGIELAEFEVKREIYKWDEIARMLGYDDFYDAHSRGVNLKLSLLRHTISAYERNNNDE